MWEKILSRTNTYREKRQRFLATCNPLSPSFILATWFGTGLIIPGPGTWGTLGGLLVALPLYYLTNAATLVMLAIALFFIGLWAAHRIEKQVGEHDLCFIVIDEVAAIFLLVGVMDMITPPLQGWEYLIAFILFRFFDARKPLLIGWADKHIKGAWGVMLDDILAAFFAYITFYISFILYTNLLPLLGMGGT